jgi:predicted  nucleic acid-binding Zn-ribbon protein
MMPSRPFLERLAEEKWLETLERNLDDLADEIKELEGLLARLTETYGRLSLLLELEKKRLRRRCQTGTS